MPSIKLHLETAEYAAVKRLAVAMNMKPEDLMYGALNRLMLEADDEALRKELMQTREWRKDNLPLWSDSAGSVHAYESMPDEEPRPKAKKPKPY
jgi:hypothetical protein